MEILDKIFNILFYQNYLYTDLDRLQDLAHLILMVLREKIEKIIKGDIFMKKK